MSLARKIIEKVKMMENDGSPVTVTKTVKDSIASMLNDPSKIDDMMAAARTAKSNTSDSMDKLKKGLKNPEENTSKFISMVTSLEKETSTPPMAAGVQ